MNADQRRENESFEEYRGRLRLQRKLLEDVSAGVYRHVSAQVKRNPHAERLGLPQYSLVPGRYTFKRQEADHG